MKVIYQGAHAGVTSADGHWSGVARREGEPVSVPDAVGKRLIARGDFAKHEPEPPRQPVNKTKE